MSLVLCMIKPIKQRVEEFWVITVVNWLTDIFQVSISNFEQLGWVITIRALEGIKELVACKLSLVPLSSTCQHVPQAKAL